MKKPVEKTVECPICKAIFDNYNLKRHLRNVHEGKIDYKCVHCGKEYVDKKGLSTHIKSSHDNVRDEQCNQCGKLFFTKDVLNRHIRNIHKHFSCNLCDEAFTSYRNLVEHKNLKHPHLNMKHLNDKGDDACKNRVCSICGEEFFQVWYFQY